MANNAKAIINDISNKLSNLTWKRYYSEFYIWITKDIQTRLFWDHNVNRNDWYLYYEAINEENARYVESYYLNKWMQWWDWWWSWDGSAIYVYCYVITPYTRQ